MDKCEIIERLKNIAEHAVYTVGEEPFVMSLDDGIAVHEAVELLKKPETNCSEIPNNSDTISRQMAIDALKEKVFHNLSDEFYGAMQVLDELPSAQPEQRYTEEELRVFQHGISLSLLSKRSSQHWQYDEDTATEIKFLERLYEKVGADMRGETE